LGQELTKKEYKAIIKGYKKIILTNINNISKFSEDNTLKNDINGYDILTGCKNELQD
jgi:hypothetical protein